MKGAFERVFSRCSKILIGGEEQEMTQTDIDRIYQEYHSLGNHGERIFAFAQCHLDPIKYD